MINRRITMAWIFVAGLICQACTTGSAPSWKGARPLKDLIGPMQRSVVTVVNQDMYGRVSSIGSGFFVQKSGVLVTNYHVLEGAYTAEIRMQDGSPYPVTTVLAKNQMIDLIKVQIDIPAERVTPVRRSLDRPAVADRIVVVGTPMGLDQTVSEGIVSAIRELPTGGTVLQITAPISQGSSGGPVFNRSGEVIGVVAFQATRGQNLNFAISLDGLEMLADDPQGRSITEWTLRNSDQGPALAASLCRKGARLSIAGEYAEALTYFQKAAEASPEDPNVWYGLGSCYVGLDDHQEAIAAYRRPIERDPDDATAQFVLAMAYKATEQYDRAVPPLLAAIRIKPEEIRPRFELGRVYGLLGQTKAQIHTYRTILDQHPDHMPTLLGLAAVLGGENRHEEAIALFVHAGEVEPENPLVHYNLGVAYSQMGRTDDAIDAYTRAIRVHPGMAAAHYNLGRSYLDRGDRKRALDQYAILKELERKAADELFKKIYPQME